MENKSVKNHASLIFIKTRDTVIRKPFEKLKKNFKVYTSITRFDIRI